MGKRDRRVDGYIDKSAGFAKPILRHLRDVVHEACPQVEETMKFGFPHFMYEGILCSMASFKAHCAFGFWKSSLVIPQDIPSQRQSMGSFGRISSLRDLPSRKTLIGLIHKAMRLNEEKVPSPTRSKRRTTRTEVMVPVELGAQLKRSSKARAAFESLPPSHRREYVEWITEAKREVTRDKRIGETIAMLSQGKSLNAKFQKAK